MSDFILSLAVVVVTAALGTALFVAMRNRLEQRRAYWKRRLGSAAVEEPLQLIPAATEATRWPERIDQAFERLVVRAGAGWSPEQLLGAVALSGVVSGGLLLLWREDIMLAGLGLGLGMLGPLLVFRMLRGRWQRRLQDQLPDAYFLLARSLRAGENFEQALLTVAQHGPQPLAAEFRQGIDKIRLGLSVPATLQLIARRLQLQDFDVLLTAVMLHRTMGGNLAVLLDRVAASTRDRNQFRGYFRAATALGRITGVFISLVPPVLLVGYWLWQPEILGRFLQTSAGQRGLAVVFLLELVGGVWLYRLLRVDY